MKRERGGYVVDGRKLRALRGNTEQQSAAQAMGVTKQQLWNWENEYSSPTAGNLLTILLYYKVQASDIARLSEEEKRDHHHGNEREVFVAL